MNNCVAINITIDNKLINKNGIPLLFYWDGNEDVDEALRKDETFKKFLIDNCANPYSFGSSKISYFYFSVNDYYEETYNENVINVQDFISITDCTDLIILLIKNNFNYLYKCSYKEDYKFGESYFEQDVCKIYEAIKSKYPNKIAKTTVLNYISSELTTTNHLSKNNVAVVIDYIEKILSNEE